MPAADGGSAEGRSACSRSTAPLIHSRYTLPDIIRRSDGKPVTVEFSRAGFAPGVTRTVTMQPKFTSDGWFDALDDWREP